MKYTLTIIEEELTPFLRSIITHSSRLRVKKWLTDMGLSWDKYWDLPLDARVHFINAFLWAEILPTPTLVLEILKKEKRTAPQNAFINYKDKWFRDIPIIKALMKRVYAQMDIDLFLKFSKRERTLTEVLSSCKKEYLPLAMSNPFVIAESWYRNLIAGRLKET